MPNRGRQSVNKSFHAYDRNTYAAEKRDALEQWANHLAVAVAQASGANVTTLRKGVHAQRRFLIRRTP